MNNLFQFYIIIHILCVFILEMQSLQNFQNKTKVWSLSMRPYYDHYTQRYINIITINSEPIGPLTNIVRRLNLSRLSDVSSRTNDYEDTLTSCLYAIEYHDSQYHNHSHYHSKLNLMNIDDISELYSFLIENNYEVDFRFTKLMQQSGIRPTQSSSSPLTPICYISYKY
jgi:hypothetical protein